MARAAHITEQRIIPPAASASVNSPKNNNATQMTDTFAIRSSDDLFREYRPRRSIRRVPLWVMMLIILISSSIAVGAIALGLSYQRSVSTINTISDSYRLLACALVENEVVELMSTIAATTQRLAEYVSTSNVSEDNPMPMEVRRAMYYELEFNKMATSIYFGVETGESVALDRDPIAGRPPIFGISNKYTRINQNDTKSKVYCSGYFPYKGWDEASWALSVMTDMVLDNRPFNSTQRVWYTSAARSDGVVFPPVYASMSSTGVVLSQPVALAVYQTGPARHVHAVVAAEIWLDYFDHYLQKITKQLIPKTILFLVERPNGFLLASSVEGEHILVTQNSETGTVARTLAVQAKDPTLRSIAQFIAPPNLTEGWTDVGQNEEGTLSNRQYLVNTRLIGLEGVDWILVVGTNKDEWMGSVTTGLKMTVGIVVGCIVRFAASLTYPLGELLYVYNDVLFSCCVVAGILTRLITSPLRRIVRDAAFLRHMDVDAVPPEIPTSRLSEVAALVDSINALTPAAGS